MLLFKAYEEANVSYILLSIGKIFLFTYINYLYKTFLFEACSSVVSLAKSFFSVVITVKFGSVRGFRKNLPVIFTYINQG